MNDAQHFRNQNSDESLALDFADDVHQIAKIRVIGVGGAGGNAINRMVEDQLNGVDFVAINTDLQTLEQNHAHCRIQIGKKLTKGLGAGGNPEIGRKAIEENKDAVIDILSETDMVFITCGMGGGTGTGAAPIVAEIARDLGSLTVGIVTTPFDFEGTKRMEKAESGISELKENVDTLIVVPNQKLISLVPKDIPLEDAFRMADEVLLHATKGISDVINVPGLVNVDFADVRTVMSQMGDALMGSGVGKGENRAKEAAEQAISSPLIEDVSIMGALGVLVNITGGKDLSLNDITEATTVIHQAAGEDANIIFGAVKDLSLNSDLRVTVIATGFHRDGIRSGFYRQKTRKVPIHSNEAFSDKEPACSKFEKEILEQVLGDVVGQDGNVSFDSKDDLTIPTFIRKQLD
jgi:cell division protein FtsZ